MTDAATLTRKADFPGLVAPDGSPWHYLDTAASAQKPQAVLGAMNRALGSDYATVHRGVYGRSAQMTLGYEAARRRAADFMGARSENEIVFVRGATEAINLVAASWGMANIGEGDRIVLSTLEHHSNIVPWQMVAERTGAQIDVCPLTEDHRIDLGALELRLPDALQTPEKRIDLFAGPFLEELARLEARVVEWAGDGRLRLIGRRHLRSNNSWMHNSQRLVKGKGRCTLLIHPDDASKRALNPGDHAEVSVQGRDVVIPVEITEDIMPGVVSIPHGWGHHRSGTGQSVASSHAGVSINDLLDDALVDPVSGTSVLNGQAVDVRVWQPEPQQKQA